MHESGRRKRPGAPGRRIGAEWNDSPLGHERGAADGGIVVTLPSVGFLAPMLFSGDFLWAAIVLFVIAIIAGALGMGGVAGITMDVARILVLIFLVLAVIALIL